MKRSKKLGCIGAVGALIVAFFIFLMVSLNMGGHMAGPTYIAPGNVGLVIDNYSGTIEPSLMPAGTHLQGPWETVIEVPTAQRTLSLDNSGGPQGGGKGAVLVNTPSNMLSADVTVQYSIEGTKADDLYKSYQDQFANIAMFEDIHLVPAVKEAINYAISDEAQMRLLDAGTYGPALTAAAAKATPDQQKILVTAPDNVRRMLIINEEQAAQYSAKYDDEWNRFQLG